MPLTSSVLPAAIASAFLFCKKSKPSKYFSGSVLSIPDSLFIFWSILFADSESPAAIAASYCVPKAAMLSAYFLASAPLAELVAMSCSIPAQAKFAAFPEERPNTRPPTYLTKALSSDLLSTPKTSVRPPKSSDSLDSVSSWLSPFAWEVVITSSTVALILGSTESITSVATLTSASSLKLATSCSLAKSTPASTTFWSDVTSPTNSS